MSFWLFLFVCDLLIPITMIIGGKMMWKHPPRNINAFIGYRTKRSMMNMDTWKFAHEHSGRLWNKIGWIMLIPSIIVHFPISDKSENEIAVVSGILCAVQCVVLIASTLPTEIALKRTFTNEGIRKKID